MDAKQLADDIRRMGAPTLAGALRDREDGAGALARLARAIGSPGDPETLRFALARDPDGAEEAIRHLEADYRAEADRRAPGATLRTSVLRALASRFWRRLV